ncbi:MAG: hypothetical protein AAF725_18965, partial [Acidobacteriota bacterium]
MTASSSEPKVSHRAAFWMWTAAAAGFLLLSARVPAAATFRKYSVAAERFLTGELPAERLLDFSPFYFALTLLAERLTGDADFWLTLLQGALASAATGGVYLLLARRFPATWASAGALIFLLDRQFLVYLRILEPETLLLALLLGVILLLDDPRPAATLACGAMAAGCLATRPTFLVAFLLVPLYFRMRRPGSWPRRSLLFLAPVLLAIVALGLYGRAAGGSLRAPVMNPGTVFFEGNQPLSRGTSARYPPLVHHRGAQGSPGRAPVEAEGDDGEKD